jgi:DNA-binding HxlR family transcriptional regulator
VTITNDRPVVLTILDDECHRFSSFLELIGRRWNSAILLAINLGATRFSGILQAVPGLSDRLLSQRLKELEAAHLLTREVIPTTPVQVRYELTERGIDLMKALQPLVDFGQRWSGAGN